MGEPYLSEIRIAAFNFPPKGWAFCNGQILPINQNQALFSLLGTTYGGDGRTNFSLPNLEGSVPFHFGNNFTLGEVGGEPTHTLTLGEIPAHTHPVMAASATGSIQSPAGSYVAGVKGANAFSNASPTTTLSNTVIGTTGSGQPHNNMPPYLVVNFVIALVGIFPSRN